VGAKDLDQLDREITEARSGPSEAYAEALERAVAACRDDAEAARYLDVLELHCELAETYDRLGRVEDALRHADVLAEQGYACAPDPRCRRAEILTRHGRLHEAAAIWDAVAQDTPEDVWVYNNAGLEYGAIGEHETALSWLTRALELAVRTGDPERLLGQLRDLRAATLTALSRDEDGLQTADPVMLSGPAGKTVRLRETGAARLLIAPLRASELRQWVADHEPDEENPAQLRAQYAADLGRDRLGTIPWPPGRNEPCWCGSGRKYKKCCGAPGSGGPR